MATNGNKKEAVEGLEYYHVDGTKLESAANRYTFVWARRAEKDRARLLDKINALLKQIERKNEQEESGAQRAEAGGAGEGKSGNSARLNETGQRLNEQLPEDLLWSTTNEKLDRQEFGKTKMKKGCI